MNIHVLYVEDEPLALELISRSLRDQGFILNAFTCPQLALDWVQAESPTIDILITDQSMPAFTGGELTAKLREYYANLPTIVVTGFGRDEFQEISSPVCYLQKPYKKQELIEVIHKMIRGEL